MKRSVILLTVLVVGASVALLGQSQSGQKSPAFEAASVKPFSDADGPGILQVSPGRLSLSGVTLEMLIQQAYTISAYRIYGGPTWLDSARFNVVAKAADVDGPLTLDQMRPMLQTLVTERFRLVVHHDTKELSLYRLVVAKDGPKFIESTASGGPQSRMAMGNIKDDKADMDTLASQLGQQLGRFVSNQTGLKGDFAFHVEWTPDPGQNRGAESDSHPSSTDTPSLFTALQEQLGLKLESSRGPVDVLVIDHVEKPTAD